MIEKINAILANIDRKMRKPALVSLAIMLIANLIMLILSMTEIYNPVSEIIVEIFNYICVGFNIFVLLSLIAEIITEKIKDY